jgi:transcriptional regulator with XRE-family HTH domain
VSIFTRRSKMIENMTDLLRKAHVPSVSRESGVSSSSLYNLRKGKTTSPHFKTIEFAAKALGGSLQLLMKHESSTKTKVSSKGSTRANGSERASRYN